MCDEHRLITGQQEVVARRLVAFVARLEQRKTIRYQEAGHLVIALGARFLEFAQMTANDTAGQQVLFFDKRGKQFGVLTSRVRQLHRCRALRYAPRRWRPESGAARSTDLDWSDSF